MPPPEAREIRKSGGAASGESPLESVSASAPAAQFQQQQQQTSSASAASNLLELDLMGDLAPSQPVAASTSSANDLLSLFGGSSAPAAAPAVYHQSLDPLADLLGGSLSSPAPAAVVSPSYAAASPLASAGGAATFVGYEKNGIKIQFTVQKDPSNAQVSQLSFIVFLATCSPSRSCRSSTLQSTLSTAHPQP